jgi:hypothetical protein
MTVPYKMQAALTYPIPVSGTPTLDFSEIIENFNIVNVIISSPKCQK